MRRFSPIRWLSALAVLVLATSAGCNDFDVQWLLDDFRVIAIRAVDGPEELVDAIVIFDPEVLEQLAELGDIENIDPDALDLEGLLDETVFRITDTSVDFLIEPLVVDPKNPSGPFRLRARACPLNDQTYRCDDAPDDLVIEVVKGIEAVRSEDLAFFFAPGVDFLNAALKADPYRGFGGLYLTIDIDIESPAGLIRASKTVSMQPKGLDQIFPMTCRGEPVRNDSIDPNRNPRLCGIRVIGRSNGRDYNRDGVMREVWRQKNNVTLCDDFDETDVYIPWDERIEVVTGEELVIRPLPPLDRDGQLRSEEEQFYTLVLPTAGQVPGLICQPERLEIDLYTTAGHLDDDRAFTRSVFGPQVSPEFTWRAPDRPGRATLYFILRDNRGGVSWMIREVEVIDPPPKMF